MVERIILFFLEEIHEAFRILGIFNEQIDTIDALPNELDFHGFLRLFSSNVKINTSSQSVSTLNRTVEN
jgi:hypothetical protein